MIRITLFQRWTVGLTFIIIAILVGPPPFTRAHEMVIGGTEATPADFPGVVQVKATGPLAGDYDQSSTNVEWCTGFFVAPNLIITAAHCLLNETGVERITNRVRVSGKDGETYTAKSFGTYPNYSVPSAVKGENTDDENAARVREDIGYIVVKNPPAGVVTYPVYVTDDNEAKDLFKDLTATVVGYGPTVWNDSEKYPSGDEGVKHFGTKAITGFGVKHVTEGTKSVPVIDPSYFVLDGDTGGGLPGDSGGPLFATIEGKTYVVGLDEGFIPNKTVPVLDKAGKPKVDKKGVVKTKEVPAYVSTIATTMTLSNLCWIESSSHVIIPGVDCTDYWKSHSALKN